MKRILPCVGCVGIVEAKLYRYCRGVHSSLVEHTNLAILHFYFLSNLIKPNYILAWLNLGVFLAMCDVVVLMKIMLSLGVAIVLRD